MYLTDYHNHSRLSFDGRDSVTAMAKAALSREIRELCCTDHVDWGMQQPGWLEEYPTDRALPEFEAARCALGDQIILRLGIELGQPIHNTAWAERVTASAPFDFVLGSLHNLRDQEDFYFLEVRSTEDCYQYLDEYFREMYDMVLWSGFDVVGHLTYPLRYFCGRDGFQLDLSRYHPLLKKTFDALIRQGKGLEVNVSGLRSNWRTTMPDINLLRLYRDCGGTVITVGSDGHDSDAVGVGIRQGYEIVRAAGFSHITTFENRKPQQVPMDKT